jgi:ribosomal protein S27AE
MEINNTNICPKCGGPTNTYRHINAKIWCSKCGFVLKEEGVPWAKKLTQEEEICELPFSTLKITPEHISDSKKFISNVYGINIDDFSQKAINNINLILYSLKRKLGNDNIYCTDELVIYIISSLCFINNIHPLTKFSFDDDSSVSVFENMIISCVLINIKEEGYDEFYEKVKQIKENMFNFDVWKV